MQPFFKITFFILLALPLTTETSDNYTAWLDTGTGNSLLKIQGKFINNTSTAMDITYKLTTKRAGKAGTSATKQSGEHTAEPGDTLSLSIVSLNITPEECYTLTLEVFSDDELIAEDSVTHCKELATGA